MMLLLTSITFGGQEGIEALGHLPEDEAEMLLHRAQEILQIPREKRIPLLVQEIKRLVKDRRGQLWSAEPERLAALLRRERGALVEVVLRALPAPLAEAVRNALPSMPRVKLTREVRPQVLDIVRWRLEDLLAQQSSSLTPFRFTDVLLLQTRELLTACDRLGARVLGPALAGLPEGERDPSIAALPPHLKQLASRAVTANAPRKLPEEESRSQIEQYGGLQNLALTLRSAGTHRLARASVAQSPEFAARLLEKHRGEFGQLLAKWIREERAKPTARGDGGRTDIVTDLERLASRGLIERPVRVTASRPPPVIPPPPSSRISPGGQRQPALSREARSVSPSEEGSAVRRDAVADRVARRAGAVSTQATGGRRDPGAEREARRPASGSRREDSAVSERGERSGAPRREPGRVGRPSREVPEYVPDSPEGSRIFRSPVARPSRGAGSRSESEADRPPRVVGTNSSAPAVEGEGTRVGRRPRPGTNQTQAPSGRGTRGGSR